MKFATVLFADNFKLICGLAIESDIDGRVLDLKGASLQ